MVRIYPVPCCRHLMPTQRAWCCTSLLKSIRRPVHLSCYHSCWRLLSLKTSSVSSSFRGGEVHLSFKEKSSRDNLFSEGLRIDGFDIPITRVAEKLTTVYLRDLPYEIPGDDVCEFFGAYGDIRTVELSKFPTFPTLCDDNLVIKTVCGCDCRVWYRDQLPTCVICRESGHRAQSCPSLACACAAVSRAIVPGTVGRPGALFLWLMLLLFQILLFLAQFP